MKSILEKEDLLIKHFIYSSSCSDNNKSTKDRLCNVIVNYKCVMCMCSDRATEDSECHFCFDNSFSHISTKTVFFRITVTVEMNTTAGMDEAAEAEELLPFEITLENFKVFKDFHLKVFLFKI